MADEFQAGICTGSWWSSARNLSTPCSAILSDVGSFGWQNEIDTKGRICDDSVSVSCNSMVYQDAPRPQTQESDSIAGGSGISIDSTLQMMGYTLSSPTTDWNQALVHGRSSEQNLCSMLEENSTLRSNFQQESGLDSSHGEKDWSPKNYSEGGGEDPLINPFKHINQVFLFEQHGLDSSSNSSNCKVNCQSLPVNYHTVSASTSLPRLFEPDRQSPYCMNYSSPMSYHMDLNEISTSFPQFVKASSPKQQSNTNHLHFSNNTPFWNTSSDIRPSFSTSTFKENLHCSSLTRKFNNEEGGDSSSMMKRSNETTFKRPRIETPSPLPTFKVRKEKLGDRVTALQQLVSPFGKTDTASVLFEAIEYIKFLHEQVGVLSTPYLKNGAPIQYQQNLDKSKDSERVKQDLRSRGLCLVPISSTFAVADTTSDFWTPTFGGSYR